LNKRKALESYATTRVQRDFEFLNTKIPAG
jgi:hypothetical protein